MTDSLLVLRICDRFRLDPDRARDLDASVIGLLTAEDEQRRQAEAGS